jgi:UDP-glucose 4-epimerase
MPGNGKQEMAADNSESLRVRGDVAVVGVTSPLGLALVDALLASGRRVRGLSRSETVPADWVLHPGFRSERFDLENPAGLVKILAECQEVIWLAHAYGVGDSVPSGDCNSNALSALCETRSSRLRRIVFLSSGGVYGTPRQIPVSECHPRHPRSVYGKSKKHMEDILLARSRCNDWSSTILRPGNIYGPHYLSTGAKGVIGAFVRALRNDLPVTLVADGRALRDFVYEGDVVRAIIHSLDQAGSVVWNVGTGVGTRVRDVLDCVCRTLAHYPKEVTPAPAPMCDPREVVLDCSKIYHDIGWLPSVDLDRGLSLMLRPLAEQFGTQPRFSISCRQFQNKGSVL